MKTCKKCNIEKEAFNFYKQPGVKDGLSARCKECCKKDSAENLKIKMQDPDFVEKEKDRHRQKYHRLDYREKHKPTPEAKKAIINRHKERYPEKYKARNASQRIECIHGCLHHWSYNEEHWTDVIDMNITNHSKAHRFIVYDQEQMMYRRSDNNELLDTKESHLQWINHCIATKPN